MSKRRRIMTLAKVAGVLGVLGMLYLILRGIGFREILDAMKRLRPETIWAALALNLAVFLLWSFRLQLMIPRAERGSILRIFPIYMAGVFGNVVTPGARVGGEPIRAYYMAKAFGGPKTGHLGVLIADKLGNMSVYMVFLLVSVGFVAVFVPLPLGVKIALEAAVALILGAVVSGVLLRKHIGVQSRLMARLLRLLYDEPIVGFFRRRFRSYQHFEDYVIGKLENVFTPIGEAATNPKTLTKVVLISTGAWLIFYLAHYVLFEGLGAGVGFFAVLIIVSIANFCGDIGFSPGGAGFMEVAMIGLCAAFGLEKETAAAVTLISRGMFYVCGLGVGGLCFGVLALIYGREKPAREPRPAPEADPPGTKQ